MLPHTTEHERSPRLIGWHIQLKPDLVYSNPSLVLQLVLKSQGKLSKVPPPSLFTVCTSFHAFFLQCWDRIWALDIAKRLVAVCKWLFTWGERSRGWGAGLDDLQRSLLNRFAILWWERVLPTNFAVVAILWAFDKAFSPGIVLQVCPTCSMLEEDGQRDANCQNHNGRKNGRFRCSFWKQA